MRSMRAFLLLTFNALMLLETYGFTDETDKQALFEFKSHVSEEKRGVLSSWNNSFPLCNWNGVTCGRKHKRVTRLDLGGLQLGGLISPSIGNLSFLILLNLTDNSFGGTIPQEIGNLFRLENLFMGSNSFTGEIPASLYNCSRLLNLDLSTNNLGQGIPQELGSLTKLSTLFTHGNNLKGKVPASLGNMTSLRQLLLGHNKLEGEVLEDIARLTQLVMVELSVNNFSGVFPPAMYNLSSLRYLYIGDNHFSGTLRPDFGDLLPNLRELNMRSNHFIGAIPITLPNISTLQKLDMDTNNLTGSIPPSFGKVQNLQFLILFDNSFGSYSPGDLAFLHALTNCTQLERLYFSSNRLGGDLPTSIGNMSKNLVHLSLGGNLISGSIPHDIENLKSLRSLNMGENMLSGTLPTSLGKLSELGSLSLLSNKISGEIPSSIGNITRLQNLKLFNNSFEGTIPTSLSNCSYLLQMWLGRNKLNGIIPRELLQLSSLFILGIEHNYLTGSLPSDVGRLENLVTLSFSNNKLSGQLPKTLGNCLSMEKLYLQGNSFDGVVPDIRRLIGIKEVDLSNNNLSGGIPGYFVNFSSLEYLNLSINNFEGRVPTEGKFQNATVVSVFGNKDLCGGTRELKLKPCFVQAPTTGTKHSFILKKVVIRVSVGITFLFLIVIAFVYLRWFRKRKNNLHTNQSPLTLGAFHQKITYGDLRNATDGFSSSNMIGSGSFGTVFKALLPAENKVVAVKVLNLQRRGAMKSFLAECESLKSIMHRNLVKLLTACSSTDFQGNDFRALIYEFMPNGSLDMWLHPEEEHEIRRPSRALTLLERLNISIDVASVLEYLHAYCHEHIVHCDLKPSNILLDDDLTAHVSDFGLSRILLKYDQQSFLNQLSSAGVRGTAGYAAPEYGMGGQPSIHGDVYSFGVLLLEMFTGKRPTNEFFEGNFTIYSFTMSALPDQVLDIADVTILHNGLRVGFPITECLTLVFKLGLSCCEESPRNRLGMSEAVSELVSIRERFFRTRRTARR